MFGRKKIRQLEEQVAAKEAVIVQLKRTNQSLMDKNLNQADLLKVKKCEGKCKKEKKNVNKIVGSGKDKAKSGAKTVKKTKGDR